MGAVNWAKNPNLARSGTFWVSAGFGNSPGAGSDTITSGLTWLPPAFGSTAYVKKWSASPTTTAGSFGAPGWTYYVDTWPVGLQRTLSVWMLYPGGPIYFGNSVRFFDQAGNQLGPEIFGNYPPLTAANVLQRVSVTATAPSGTYYAVYKFGMTGAGSAPAVNNTLFATALMFSDGGDPPSYFDGDSPAANGGTYGWSGTAGNSPSNYLVDDPTTLFQPRTLVAWKQTRPNRNIVHEIRGRADPEITLAVPGTRSGTASVVVDTAAAVFAAERALAGRGTWHLTDDELGLDLELAITDDVQLDYDPDYDVGVFEIPFREIVL